MKTALLWLESNAAEPTDKQDTKEPTMETTNSHHLWLQNEHGDLLNLSSIVAIARDTSGRGVFAILDTDGVSQSKAYPIATGLTPSLANGLLVKIKGALRASGSIIETNVLLADARDMEVAA